MEYLAKGKRGIVYKEGKLVIKKENPKSTAIARIENEARFLQIVNKLGIGPKYISNTKEELVMKFVEGERIDEFVVSANKKKILIVLKNVLNQCFVLDSHNISKEEMHRPYKHILIEKKVVMIDWERAHKSLKPSNVTQFCQYLCSAKFGGLLKKKGIDIDKKKMIDLALNYRKNINKKNFDNILGILK